MNKKRGLLDVGLFESETLLAVNSLQDEAEDEGCHTEASQHDERPCVVELCGVGNIRIGLVEYLSDNGFQVFIVSGAERTLLRELSEGNLDEWIPAYNVIGTTFSLTAPGQGDTAGRNYNYTNDDKMIYEGNMTFKNLKINKVISIIDEIGIDPILAFGNSSGDFSMGTYTLQNGGKAYMLLCDDTQREYGDTEKAEKFAKQCAELGFETVSMKNDFATIYGNDVTLIKDAA